jgi:hypothetical protein
MKAWAKSGDSHGNESPDLYHGVPEARSARTPLPLRRTAPLDGEAR